MKTQLADIRETTNFSNPKTRLPASQEACRKMIIPLYMLMPDSKVRLEEIVKSGIQQKVEMREYCF
jgi:hypothetical protein